MKNLTITVDEDVAHWARVLAAQQNTSISRLVAEMLRERMQRVTGLQAAKDAFFSVKPKDLGGGPYPRRNELHDRPRLRRQ